MKRVLSDGVVPVKVWTDEIEETALEQLRNLSQLPFVHKHVTAMPDAHAVYSSTVGSVIPTKATIISAAVGVDTDCGMMAQRLPRTAKVCLTTCQPCAFPLKPRSLTDARTTPLRYRLTDNRRGVSKPLGFEIVKRPRMVECR